MKSLTRFFQERIFKDAFLKVLHVLVILALCYGFTLSSNTIVSAQPSILGITVDSRITGLFGRSYTTYEAYMIFVFGAIMIMISNISYMVRSWKFDLFAQFLPLFALNSIYWYGGSRFLPIPFAEINTLFLANIAWCASLRLARTETDQQLIRSIFGRYVDNEVAEAILSKGENVEFDGQMRDMTVLFSDIRGFTSLSETLHPKRLIMILSSYLTTMTDVILQNRGTVDKFIGDAIMAFWNAPTKDRNHTKNAIRTALRMQAKMTEIRTMIPELSTTNIGVGIARGPMVVGNVGGKNRFDYTVLGDTVNLASRLESLTKQYKVGILINQGACEPTEGVIFRQIDVIVVKGKSKAVAIYEPMVNNQINVQLKEKYEYAFLKMQSGETKKAFELFQRLANQGDGPSQVMYSRLSGLSKFQTAPKVWEWETK